MKVKKSIPFMILTISLLFVTACTTAPYSEQFTLTGTIEEFITKEKFFVDDKFLLVKEYGGESEGRGQGNIYEIPIDSFEDYEVGQNVVVVIFSNTDADVWDPDNMKFEITIVE